MSSSKCTMLLGALGLLVAIAMPLVLGSYGISLLTQMLIFALLAMSLDILVGYAGLVSLNHASFFGIAAYTVGILSTHGYNNFWLGLAAGVVAALLLGLVLGLLVLRSSGPYFLMITLAFGQMLFALAWKWRFLTGGDDGLPGIARPDLGIPVSLWPTNNFYYLVLAVWTLSLVFLYWFIRSPRDLKNRAKSRGGSLSGGEQQMLAIGRAMISNPEFLLMDEPSEGLAPAIIEYLIEKIDEMKTSGLSILLVEQNLRAALRLADHLYIMNKGRTKYIGKAGMSLTEEEVKEYFLLDNL
ncbi:MAG: ABC transporter permease subunit [bacterium]